VSSANQAVFLNAIPLLAVAALYLGAAALLAPTYWRERLRTRELEFALALVFPFGGAACAIVGALVLVEQEPLAGNAWVSFAAILLALVPGLVFFARAGDRAIFLAAPRLAREAAERTVAEERLRERVTAFTTELARRSDEESVARLLLEYVVDLLPVEFASLSLIEGREAKGLLARLGQEELAWWRELRLDLESEPSAIASAAFEAAPFTVYDVSTSSHVSHRIADRVGAKSGVWVPLVSGETVVAVLAAATTRHQHAFTGEEIRLLQELAAETANALERSRSAAALGEALERERLVAELSRRLRAKPDLDAAMRLAVEEAGPALGASRCYLRLGEPGAMLMGAEWGAEGFEPIADRAAQLPVPNLALRARRTVAVGDVLGTLELDDPTLGSRDLLLSLNTRAVLATPIVVFDEVIGVLGFHRPEAGPWSESDVALAEAVARELGLVLHTARVLAESERRLAQESALLAAAEAVTSELEAASVLQRLVDEVAQLLGGQAADCYLLDRERGVLRCAAVHGLPEELIGYEAPATRGVSGEALARGRPVNAPDYATLRDPQEHPAYSAFTHAIIAPIIWSGEPLGVLCVGSTKGGHVFDDADADVLQAFASLASLALRNARAFEERSRQARIQRGFYLIASVLGQPLALEGTLKAVAQAAREALGGDFASVLMPRGRQLELAGGDELPEALVEALSRGLPASESALYRAAEGRRMLAAPRVRTDARFEPAWQELAERAGYRSLLAIPVQGPGEDGSPGLVIVFFTDERRFTDDDLELARQLASAARGALERSGLFEQERRARSLAQQLARTGSLVGTGLDPAAVLDEVVQQAPSLVGAEACVIRVLDDAELVVNAAEGDGLEAVLGARSRADGWLSGDVLHTRAPVAIEDATGDERLVGSDPLLELGYRAFLGVPLAAAEGALHGVLAVYARRPRAWSEDEIEALLALAGNASAALSNAELYQTVALEKEQSDAILSNIADGIVAVDREGNVVLWNNAAEQITGVPATEALGRTPQEVLGRKLESDGVPGADRLVSLLRGGEEVWLSVTEAIMRDPAEAVAGRIFAFRDISDERRVERMKSEFVATVSQELRRPLTSIYGFAETLLRRDVLFGEEQRRTFLGYIASESERLTTIVDALLNVARLDTGDLQVSLVPTDVGSVVSEVVSLVEEGALDGHRFVVDLPQEPLEAEADPDKLREVLAQLIDNAVRYSPGGGTVTIAARRRSDTVEVSIADEGVGIPQTERQRIFRKFYRGDAGPGRSGRAGGTGLGLFIVEGLVAAMGGRIWVDSKEGEGSSFTFELPLRDASAAALVRESGSGGV
jgi:PAS domain S-box-containing protein